MQRVSGARVEAASTARPRRTSTARQTAQKHHAVTALSPTGEGSALALQRSLGNRAVGRMIADRRPTNDRVPAIQRFVGHEHREIGDAADRTIDLGRGVKVTWGQLVAIAGDEYGSFTDLLADTKTNYGRARIRAALEHDGVPGTLAAILPATGTTRGGKTAAESQDARFNDLVVNNIEHFAAGGTAIQTWTNHHQDALGKALNAGIEGSARGAELAYGTEAFGQHFLTDTFSAGHVRTPRQEIVSWYSGVFGPRVIVPLVDDLRRRVIYHLAAQISASLKGKGGSAPRLVLDAATRAVEEAVVRAVAASGGLPGLGAKLGLYIAGAISGTLHDLEGERGVWVASTAQPAPWKAYGDDRLKDSPETAAEARAAVIMGKLQVDQALAIGQRFRKAAAPGSVPPATVYFGFNRSDVDRSGGSACDAAADYLKVHPDAMVRLVGHTDPVGDPVSNEHLGMRRSEAVAAALTARGIDPSRILFESRGEDSPATQDKAQYQLNRRVDFVYGTGPASVPTTENDEAFAALTAEIPAPYAAVLDHVPYPVPQRNIPLEDWHWGSMPPNIQLRLNQWMNDHIKGMIPPLLAGPELRARSVTIPWPVDETITIDPRAALTAESALLFADPVRYLERAFGEPAGP